MAKKSILPIGDRVAVKAVEAKDEASASGIILPDDVKQEKSNIGEVIAVGDKIKVVSVGDTVLYSEYGYDTVTIDDEEIRVIKEEKLLAIIK